MFDFIKRIFVRKRTYLTSLRPCPCCGGRHIRFRRAGCFDLFNRIICDDCGFTIGNRLANVLLDDWEKLPRKKEVRNESHAD